MRSFTVHTRPGRPPVLVREGFSWPALLFGPLWLAAHRAWVPACLMAAVTIALWTLAPPGVVLLVGAGLGWFTGLLGQDMRRWSLARRGFMLAEVIAARDEEAALGRLLTFRPDLQTDFAGAVP